jgi:hypothetical protein
MPPVIENYVEIFLSEKLNYFQLSGNTFLNGNNNLFTLR